MTQPLDCLGFDFNCFVGNCKDFCCVFHFYLINFGSTFFSTDKKREFFFAKKVNYQIIYLFLGLKNQC